MPTFLPSTKWWGQSQHEDNETARVMFRTC